MLKAYKYRIYPTKEQKEYFVKPLVVLDSFTIKCYR